MESKQAQRSKATRGKLVAAARPLFAERGYAAVGTEEIVRAAGVTRGALYHQFRDKAELFAAVVEEVSIEATQAAAAGPGATAGADALGELRAGARLFLEAAAVPWFAQIVLLDGPAVLGWERWRAIGMGQALQLVAAVLQAGMDSGTIAPRPVEPLAHVFIAALDEGALYVSRADDPAAARREIEDVLDVLIDALAAR